MAEEKLAKVLAISRTPVREALALLFFGLLVFRLLAGSGRERGDLPVCGGEIVEVKAI